MGDTLYFSKELEDAFGPDWRRYRPCARFLLEHRYIRRGVEEPWKPFEAANSLEQSLCRIDNCAVALHPALQKIQEERRAYAEEQQRKKEEEHQIRIEREEQERIRDRSRATFIRMASDPKYAPLCLRWNRFIDAKSKDSVFKEWAEKNQEFRADYDRVILSITIPSKRKAMKEFFRKWDPKGETAIIRHPRTTDLQNPESD